MRGETSSVTEGITRPANSNFPEKHSNLTAEYRISRSEDGKEAGGRTADFQRSPA
jgi:hypothetical protein